MNPIVVPGPDALAETAARWTAELMRAAADARGACYLALAGGDTPRACYERLSQSPFGTSLPWSKVHIFWSDERRVPLTHPESNYGMARSALLSRVPVPFAQVHPMPAQDPDARRAAEGYARLIEQVVPKDGGELPRFDLILLGLGEDGHTASLFPGDDALSEQRALVRPVQAARPPPGRLTITLPLINAARAVLFLVQGARKRSALDAVLRQNPAVPAGLVRPTAGELHFIVDREALPET